MKSAMGRPPPLQKRRLRAKPLIRSWGPPGTLPRAIWCRRRWRPRYEPSRLFRTLGFDVILLWKFMNDIKRNCNLCMYLSFSNMVCSKILFSQLREEDEAKKAYDAEMEPRFLRRSARLKKPKYFRKKEKIKLSYLYFCRTLLLLPRKAEQRRIRNLLLRTQMVRSRWRCHRWAEELLRQSRTSKPLPTVALKPAAVVASKPAAVVVLKPSASKPTAVVLSKPVTPNLKSKLSSGAAKAAKPSDADGTTLMMSPTPAQIRIFRNITR